jgi:predicted nicotinamide N-methyase
MESLGQALKRTLFEDEDGVMNFNPATRSDQGDRRSSTHMRSNGTAYSGPVTATTIRIRGRSVRLVRPGDPDLLLDDPDVIDWNRRDDYMPYWAYLWPASYLLAEAVMAEDWLDGTGGEPIEVLEIGCGLGLAGLVALGRGLRVQFSDYDRAPLEFVARSVAENGLDETRYSTRILDWRDLPDERFPVILGSDVIYEPKLVPLVANVLATMLAAAGVGLIASPYRIAARGFPAAVEALGLNCRAEPVSAQTEDRRLITGTVYRVSR